MLKCHVDRKHRTSLRVCTGTQTNSSSFVSIYKTFSLGLSSTNAKCVPDVLAVLGVKNLKVSSNPSPATVIDINCYSNNMRDH